MLYYILIFTKIYLPILMGIGYVLGYQRKKLNNLLKYFVVVFHLQILQMMIQNSIQMTIPEIIMIPIYAYLTIFHYAYSELIYDVLFAPLYALSLQKYKDLNKDLRNSAAYTRQTGKEGTTKMGKYTKWLLQTLKEENIYLLK